MTVLVSSPIPWIRARMVCPTCRHFGGLSESNALWGSRGDHITRQKRHARGELFNDRGHVEDHGVGVVALALLTVDIQFQRQVVRVVDGACVDDHRPERATGIQAFALEPLAMQSLEVTGRDIVEDGVAKNMLVGSRGRNVSSPFTDDDGQFDFVVKTVGERFMAQYFCAMANQRGSGLCEELNGWRESIGRTAVGQIAFDDVLSVVAANVEYVSADRSDGRKHDYLGIGQSVLSAVIAQRIAAGLD